MTDLLPGFESRRVPVMGIEIACRVAGNGPPLLMLHGYPQTHVCWHRLAPALANLKLQETLRNQSVRDQLTQLFNRRYLSHLVDRHTSGMRDYSAPLWTLLMFDAFLKNVMQGSDASMPEKAAG